MVKGNFRREISKVENYYRLKDAVMANELNNQISSWELITIRLELLNQL